jgi:hypothetical protein
VRHPRLAALLLLIAVMKSTAWQLSPTDAQAHVWNASGALAIAMLLSLLALTYMSAEVWLVVALVSGIELQTAACSFWYLASPWVVKPGDELCSAGLHFPVGLVLLWAFIVAAMCLRGIKK